MNVTQQSTTTISPSTPTTLTAGVVTSNGTSLASAQTLTLTGAITAASLSTTTALPVGSGGTGTTSLTANQMVVTQSNGTIGTISSGSQGQLPYNIGSGIVFGTEPVGIKSIATGSFSSGGSVVSNQIFSHPNYKKVLCYLSTAAGSATITFAAAFTHTPYISTFLAASSGQLGTAVVSSWSTTTCSFSCGSASTGFLCFEGF